MKLLSYTNTSPACAMQNINRHVDTEFTVQNIRQPLSSNSLTTSSLITVIPTVVELVAHPVLRNATTTGTRELTATATLVRCGNNRQNSHLFQFIFL